jgi:hypothetical protein
MDSSAPPPGWVAPVRSPAERSRYWAPTPDEQQRAAQIAEQQRIELAAIEAKLDRRNPNKAKTEYDPLAKLDRELPSFLRDKDKPKT